jgi:hypothetical protein
MYEVCSLDLFVMPVILVVLAQLIRHQYIALLIEWRLSRIFEVSPVEIKVCSSKSQIKGSE